VVAHFHLVLRIGAVFGVLLSVYFWSPLFLGLAFSQVLSIRAFLTIFLSVNLTFIPIHTIGLAGYARKVVDSPIDLQFLTWVSRTGRGLSLLGLLGFIYSFVDLFTGIKIILRNHGKTAEFLQGTLKAHTF
jgi:cytochrome c oxidase subunit 1